MLSRTIKSILMFALLLFSCVACEDGDTKGEISPYELLGDPCSTDKCLKPDPTQTSPFV